MELKPGQSTAISVQFKMHKGMEGPHDFRLHIPTNDPQGPDRELVILSNFVQ